MIEIGKSLYGLSANREVKHATFFEPRTATGSELSACQHRIVSQSFKLFGSNREKIHRGYYTVAIRYEFYVRVARTISHE